MKKFLYLIVIFFSIPASAQNKADIEVSYTVLSPSLKDGKTVLTNQYILLANNSISKFYSPKTEYIDSLNSTPEGKAKYQEMTRSAYLGGKIKDLPRRDGSYYITKSFDDKSLRCYDVNGLDKFYYEETPEEWNWDIKESTKEILGYECIEATTDFHGRKWTVLFTPEVPVHNGPWKFDGLPGLILEAVAEGDQYKFLANGIQQTEKIIQPVYLENDYEKTSRLDFLKDKRSFLDNTLSRLNAQLGDISLVKVEDENGNDISNSLFASSKVVDFIETDYH